MDINFQIFRAAFFSELETLKKLIVSCDDLLIKIPIPENDYRLYWEAEHLEINILEILNWTNYTFYEYFEEEKTGYKSISADSTVYEVTFNPSIHYKNTIECLEWICNTFNIDNYFLTDYSRFRLLRHFIFDGDYWLDEEDLQEALERNFKQIDLDLINQAELGNCIKVYELILQGANPNIDPIDFSNESYLYYILDSDFQYHKMLTKKIIGEKQFFETENSYKMLESLYQAGVSNYILDIIHYNKLDSTKYFANNDEIDIKTQKEFNGFDVKKMQYKFVEKDNLWGLQNQQGKWVVEPQFEDYYNRNEGLTNDGICIYPDNMYIFLNQNKYYLFNEKLENLYPNGVVDFNSFDKDCNVCEYDCNEYAYLVKDENGLYGFTYSFINTGGNSNLPSGLVEGHLKTEWEQIFNIDYFGFELIKNDSLYYCSLFYAKNKISIKNKAYVFIPNANFNELLNDYPVIEFPTSLKTLGTKRFMVELYYCYYEWSQVYYQESKSKVKEMKYCYSEIGNWLNSFIKKNKLPMDLLAWVFLKLFYPDFNGKTISKNIRKQLLELDKK